MKNLSNKNYIPNLDPYSPSEARKAVHDFLMHKFVSSDLDIDLRPVYSVKKFMKDLDKNNHDSSWAEYYAEKAYKNALDEYNKLFPIKFVDHEVFRNVNGNKKFFHDFEEEYEDE